MGMGTVMVMGTAMAMAMGIMRRIRKNHPPGSNGLRIEIHKFYNTN